MVPGLSRVTPHLELIVVATHFVNVFGVVEAKLLLPVVAAVIVVEEEVVVGGDGGQAMRVVIGGAPDLGHDVLGEGVDE